MNIEQEIQQEAEKYTNNSFEHDEYINHEDIKDTYILGVKSNVAKKFWFNEFKQDLEIYYKSNQDDFDRGKGIVLLNQFIEKM